MKETINYYTLARPEIASVVPKDIKTILDIGTGEGYFLKLVKEQKGCETWGIEVNTAAAEVAKNHADRIISGKIEDVLHSIPDGYFDCITFNDVLEHMVEPSDILKMIKPKLSANGIIIASIPNVRYFFNLYEVMIKKDWEYKDAGILDSTHLRFFTQKSMKSMIEKAGYKLESQTGLNEIISWKFQLFNLLTLGKFTDTRYLQFICIAKKS
jgi:2-polyprenyl-3-methyl-5-hydroxy-6-metoxy-1,4-benzoquinol methylase